MSEAQQLADRYAAVWNEGDPDRRRQAIAELWNSEGEHYVGEREVRGHEQLETRIATAHDKNVREGGHRFRSVNDARALRDVVVFHWEMLSSDTEDVAARGLEVLLLDEDGRIRVDYQFILQAR